MAVYKVPQDVEAEDHLIGPFSFRQFGYLFAVGIAGFVLFILFTKAPLVVAAFFAVIFLPPMAVLIAISLPLKKDQPMEMYLLAMVRFLFKPRLRLWAPDGSMALVDITAPKIIEQPRTKAFSGDEANSQLAYLAGLMDSRGWSAKGVSMAPTPTIALSDDTPDVFDESTGVGRSFEDLLSANDNRHRQQVISTMHQPSATPAPLSTPTQSVQATIPAPSPTVTPTAAQPTTPSLWDQATPQFKPYPNMHQHVINPSGEPNTPAPVTVATPVAQPIAEPVVSASVKPVAPDIMRLAENKDLSISAIAHEANRLRHQQAHDDDEVVISLR